ncbi:TAXI family TRAP transporter solute-binding subunit [Nocardioides litoris]|uniref:TAXI family TRAP transporter solute-binding subunit n=1 Tax=Nocardioides litoris TaxID=1926648 RepID=UPI00111CD1B9|nr:TAXI family TRAP transporter solute-binding subunit [Nocardioides litoris]
MTRVGRRTVLLAGAGLLGACGGDPSWTGATGRLRLATGNAGAVFFRYGEALVAEAAARVPGLEAAVVPSGGSVDNVRLVAGGRADVGFCLGDTALLALAGDAPFDAPQRLVAVCRLYDSFLQVLVRADSAVRSVRDLAGRRVEAGQAGSGTRLAVGRALAAAGLRPGEVELGADDLATGLARLRAGRTDALCFVSGYPIPAIVEAGRTLPLRALDLGAVVRPMAERYGAQYVAGPLPAGGYGLPASVETLSVKTYLVAAPDLPAPVAEAVAGVVFGRQDALTRRVPDVRQPTVAAGVFTEPLDLHPGSVRWFRERDRSLRPPGA